MHTNIGSSLVNKTNYNYVCGFWNTCQFYDSLENCQGNPSNLPCHEVVNSTIIEYLRTCEERTVGRSYKDSSTHTAHFRSRTSIHCWDSKTGNEYPSQTFYATEKEGDFLGDMLSVMGKLLGGIIVFGLACDLSQNKEKSILGSGYQFVKEQAKQLFV